MLSNVKGIYTVTNLYRTGAYITLVKKRGGGRQGGRPIKLAHFGNFSENYSTKMN